MRVLLWHGWLLEGSGTNVFTARIAATLRRAGHDVLLLCQEPHPERYDWIDAWGSVDEAGPSTLTPNPDVRPSPGEGRCVLLRPAIGSLLPVFVLDEYEGFEVSTFVDLTDGQLERYLARNVAALRAAAAWHGTETTFAGHLVPGGPVAARALPAGSYVVKTAGSDVEYALRPQVRYRTLAAEGIRPARALIGPSADVLARAVALAGTPEARTRLVTPGVDGVRFRPMVRRDALLAAASHLDDASHGGGGRPSTLDERVAAALAARDADELDHLAHTYDQEAPDTDVAARLRKLADRDGPLVGYLGKMIPQKGVQLALAGAALTRSQPDVLLVGFGLWREWLAALHIALASGDAEGLTWLGTRGVLPDDVPLEQLASAGPGAGGVTWTGRLDHRFAPEAVAAMDVLVVPSILDEAFGMVAAEGAAAGALPLVARHSGLAEVAGVIEQETGRPGWFSFEPGPGACTRIAEGVDRLLRLPLSEREQLRHAVADVVRGRWSWEQAASDLLE